jgi:putative (di)nucleoside polyphosphate hydrolase
VIRLLPSHRRQLALPRRRTAIAVIMNPQGLILAGENLFRPGTIKLPQGGVEDGESWLRAAFREGREETGITQLRFMRAIAGGVLHFPDKPVCGFSPYMEKFSGATYRFFLFRTNQVNTDPVKFLPENEKLEFSEFGWYRASEIITRSHGPKIGDCITRQRQPIYRHGFEKLGVLKAA